MLDASPSRKALGASLVELMIGIAIFAIAMGMGVPSYRAWIQNTQIRTAAESLQNAMQKAKVEAVKRNANVEFVLAADPIWKIKLAGGIEIERVNQEEFKTHSNGGAVVQNVTLAVTPNTATTLTYTGLGQLADNADGTAKISIISLDSSTLSAAESRNLQINVGDINGNAKICDPNLNNDSPSVCPP
jgi:type IV fimbrial biogenesis protein FimT